MSRQHQSKATKHSDRSGYFNIRVFIAGTLSLLAYAISIGVSGL